MKMMQTTRWLATTAALLLAGPMSLAGEIDPNLQDVMDESPPGTMISALVYLVDRVDLGALNDQLTDQRVTRRDRHERVVLALRDRARASQIDLLQRLDKLQDAGDVASYEAYWIANAVRVEATADVIIEVSQRDDIEYVFLNYPIEGIRPVDPPVNKKGDPIVDPDGGVAAGGPEPGLIAIRADEAWAAGFDGFSILVADIDTGVEGDHPALATRWAGIRPEYAAHPEWAWLDPYAGLNDFPYDEDGHGTHTTGTICGGAPGDQVGVAPGAHWIAAGPIDRGGETTTDDVIEAFQWTIDPDGDPSTVWDVPSVCTNSWGFSDFSLPDCDEIFWSFLDAMEAAGTVVLFAAGNESTMGLRRPADRATDDFRSFAVGAVNGNVASWPIAPFSSRGPTFCTPDGSLAIKPDIAAPGVAVRSSYKGGIYLNLSGTSMATPHIAGVMALVLQACPSLSVEQVKQIMFDAGVDLGAPGEDNDYGHGMIDAYEAVQIALELCGATPPIAYDAWYAVPLETPYLITLVAADHDDQPAPPVLTYNVVSLPAGGSLADAGNGHLITSNDLPYELTDGGNVVEYVPNAGFFADDAFTFVANDGGVPPEGGDSEIATVTLFVRFDAPTIITPPTLADGFQGLVYTPVQLEAEQGQPELMWEVLTVPYAATDLGSSGYQAVGVAQGWIADDGAWSYTLPFSFPFYGEPQTQVTVSSNGWLNFGSWTGSSASNSRQGLINNKRISPLWDDQRTNWPGADIYIDDTIPDQVTIRWDTVTYLGQHPCEYSCTLFSDGRIRFDYGPGNTPVTPTIGISAGNGVEYLVSAYDEFNDLNNANTLDYLVVGALPDGMTLSTGGEVTGTPTETGTFHSLIRVTDALLRTDERVFEVTITEEACLGDIDGDGFIGVEDLLAILASWGACQGCPTDIDGDGLVQVGDLLIVLARWGDCP